MIFVLEKKVPHVLCGTVAPDGPETVTHRAASVKWSGELENQQDAQEKKR